MQDFLLFISQLIWGSVIIYGLLGLGLWFTFTTRFVQFRTPAALWQALKAGIRSTAEGISPIQALCVSLASRAGSGSLPGVAVALTAGGPGALFWMWIAGIIGMASAFAEGTLAQLFKTRDVSGRLRGGPAWYISYGLGLRGVGVVFALLLIVTFGLLFNGLQANTLALTLGQHSALPPTTIAILLAIATGLALLTGTRGIARLCQCLVPLLALSWLGFSLWIVASHLNQLPTVLQTIINGAFGARQAAAGLVSYSINQALTNGLQRGMFSTEAGLGIAPNAAGMALARPAHPVFQGLIQMAGVVIDTLLLCTATAAMVLFSGLKLPPNHPQSGEQLLQQATALALGPQAAAGVAAVLGLCAWVSLLANYLYVESNLHFLTTRPRPWIGLFKLTTLAIVAIGVLFPTPTLWQLADLLVPVMAVLNIGALLLLSPLVRVVTLDYARQRRLGLTPILSVHKHPQLSGRLPPGIW